MIEHAFSRWAQSVGLAVFVLLLLLLPQSTWAQEKKEKLPDPEEVTIKTGGLPNMIAPPVTLKATYYGSKEGKEAAPVVLLHGYKGSREDYGEFAPFLQEQGYAVLAVDLRGHGESTEITGTTRTLPDVKNWNQLHFKAMAQYDMEAVKGWLLEKHNAGELNIERLAVVAADMSTIVAVNWALKDWSWPILNGLKQGQDVKALVLLSPQRNFRGYTMMQALRAPTIQRGINFQLIVGENDRKALQDAEAIHNILSVGRPDPKDPEEIVKYKNLFFDKVDTAFQGTKLLTRDFKIEPRIAKFIELRVVNQDTFLNFDLEWKERENPFD